MSSSPRTPACPGKVSNIDSAYTSAGPKSNGYSPPWGKVSQVSARYEMSSPSSRLESPADLKYDINVHDHENDNGFGNLADELAEAWDEDRDGEPNDLPANGSESPVKPYSAKTIGSPSQRGHHESSIGMMQSPALDEASALSWSSRQSQQHFTPRRQGSKHDDSDYREESEHDNANDNLTSLQACVAAIETLGRWVHEAYGSEVDSVIKRVADSLKELPSQSGVENGATRLMTAHSALTSHLSHQTRSILTLTHAILSPLSIPPDTDTIDGLLPLLTSLCVILPSPDTQCLSSLHSLQTSTTDLQTTLTYLSDTIYVTRQTMTMGSRKLRIVSEVLLEMRREAEVKEEAVRWIEKGRWEQRLASRECAKVCGDVVGGFEEICEQWRKRFAMGVEVGAA